MPTRRFSRLDWPVLLVAANSAVVTENQIARRLSFENFLASETSQSSLRERGGQRLQ
jgi:hypothetical protein